MDSCFSIWWMSHSLKTNKIFILSNLQVERSRVACLFYAIAVMHTLQFCYPKKPIFHHFNSCLSRCLSIYSPSPNPHLPFLSEGHGNDKKISFSNNAWTSHNIVSIPTSPTIVADTIPWFFNHCKYVLIQLIYIKSWNYKPDAKLQA